MRKAHLLAMTALLVSAAVPALADWNTVGSLKFNGTATQDFTVPATAHGMTTVGLIAQGASARCSHIVATYANGDTKELTLSTGRSVSPGPGQFLAAGQMATVDVEGPADMTQLALTCHADAGLHVTIAIKAS